MSSTHPLSRYPITNRFWQMNMRIKKVAFWGVRLSEKKVYKLIITAMTILNDFIFCNLTKLTAIYLLLDVSFCQQLAGAESFSIITHLWLQCCWYNLLQCTQDLRLPFLWVSPISNKIVKNNYISIRPESDHCLGWVSYPKKIPIQNFLVVGHFPCSYGKKTH